MRNSVVDATASETFMNGGATLRSAAAIGDRRTVGEDMHSVTIFANELSRDGMSVDLDGMDFSNYEKNPVVLYAHDHTGKTGSGGLPIGKTSRLWKRRYSTPVEARGFTGGFDPDAAELLTPYRRMVAL